jgi:hypothetical protein
MLLSFAYLAFSAVLRLLLAAGAVSSPKMSSCLFCDISSSCLGGNSGGALRCDLPIAPFLPR